MNTYTTTTGDVLDEICARHYDGDTTMLVPVLDANPGLADRDPVLPSGIVVTLPARATQTIKTTRLWD